METGNFNIIRDNYFPEAKRRDNFSWIACPKRDNYFAEAKWAGNIATLFRQYNIIVEAGAALQNISRPAQRLAALSLLGFYGGKGGQYACCPLGRPKKQST